MPVTIQIKTYTPRNKDPFFIPIDARNQKELADVLDNIILAIQAARTVGEKPDVGHKWNKHDENIVIESALGNWCRPIALGGLGNDLNYGQISKFMKAINKYGLELAQFINWKFSGEATPAWVRSRMDRQRAEQKKQNTLNTLGITEDYEEDPWNNLQERMTTTTTFH